MSVMDVLNSGLLYTLVALGLLFVLGVCVFFFVRARRRALELGVSPQKLNSAMRGAAVFSIVPSLSIIIGLMSMAPLLGVPWPWFRLSVVGALSYELMAADMAATSAGYESLQAFSATGQLTDMTAIMFVMSVSIMAGMVCNIFILKKLVTTSTSFGQKNGARGALILSCFTVAMMATLLPMQLFQGTIAVLVIVISALVTFVLTHISSSVPKAKWLRDYIMSFALIIGMVSAVLITNLMK